MYMLPEYEKYSLDILDGASTTQWNSEVWSSKRYERLSSLEGRMLMNVNDIDLGNGVIIPTGKTLRGDDYTDIIKSGKTSIEVLDPVALIKFAERKLHLRQHITTPSGEVIAKGGDMVTREIIDRCILNRINEVAVVGSGDVVGFNASIIMIILIFIGMTMALQELFWQPMMKLVDSRKAELEEGRNCVRTNREQHTQIEKDREDKLREMHGEYQKKLREARHEAMVEVDKILGQTNHDVKAARDRANRELKAEIEKAEESLRQSLPELAKEVSSAVSK
jgi:F-type H+-transporting ATPase subunit b